MTVEQDISPLVKTVTVPVGVDRAFEAFTAETSTWWPLFGHSVGEGSARGVRLEGAVGGQIVEYGADGDIATWGTLSEWDPPASLTFSWHPGQNPAAAGQVTVTFTPIDDGTEVKLTHTGWDRRPDATQARRSYDTGWDYVLTKYTEFATP
ncbi:SRPBCC domain-containing protein [Kribbella sp.]|uniref:SRPBCC domain-containing protein n=1 Tax=Kribbella sp. TaxID=1871183 RepID=UPI002D284B0E|nr:SRPBCC domain-containing protein [Kribbella sp.]HZX06772.1 SRPBCC domain-containing protein [Kribbella sp.]